MTLFVERLVVRVLHFAVLFRGDARLDAFFDQGFAELVAVITTIASQRLGLRQGAEHEPCPFMIAHLPGREKQDQGLAIAIGDGMKLGVQAALRAPDTAGNSPFFSRLAAVR